MDKASQQSIQEPRIAQDLVHGQIGVVEDRGEYYSLSLIGVDLSGQSASDIVFEESHLGRVKLVETKLEKVRFTDMKIDDSDFSGSVWGGARLTRVVFSNCRLIGMQLFEAELNDVRFSECNMAGALLGGIVSRHIEFNHCILREAFLQSARLNGASFKKCDLSGANLEGAELKGADFRGAKLGGVQVGPKEMQGAIIDPSQASQVAALLGVAVKDVEDEPYG